MLEKNYEEDREKGRKKTVVCTNLKKKNVYKMWCYMVCRENCWEKHHMYKKDKWMSLYISYLYR